MIRYEAVHQAQFSTSAVLAGTAPTGKVIAGLSSTVPWTGRTPETAIPQNQNWPSDTAKRPPTAARLRRKLPLLGHAQSRPPAWFPAFLHAVTHSEKCQQRYSNRGSKATQLSYRERLPTLDLVQCKRRGKKNAQVVLKYGSEWYKAKQAACAQATFN